MKKIIAPLLLLILSGCLYAQDPHFSQFFSSPLTVNPAFTGKFDGALRVNGNYRNQWPTINNAFITSTGSVDFHVGKDAIPTNDTWGIGATFLTDKSAGGAVNMNYFSLSTAYHKGLDENGFTQLSGGVQLTYSNTYINTSGLSLGFNTDGSPILYNQAYTGINNLSSNYIDLNAGLLYSTSTNDRNNFYGGVSVYHINQPTQKLSSSESHPINTRTTIQAGTYFGVSPNTTLHLSGIETMQAGASETVLGGAFQFIAHQEDNKSTSLYVGSWLRLNDAIIPYVGLEFNDVRFGLTYDVTTSTLKTASENKGGIELSAVYIYRPSTDKPINCPKF